MFTKKYFLLCACVIFLQSVVTRAQPCDDKDGFIRNSDCSFRGMHYDDAIKACPAGTHLPTAREVAEYSQSKGAKGISRTKFDENSSAPSGYTSVASTNPEGTQEDAFYYSNEGYSHPGTADTGSFWLSSLPQGSYGIHYARVFSNSNGSLSGVKHRTSGLAAVWCFKTDEASNTQNDAISSAVISSNTKTKVPPSVVSGDQSAVTDKNDVTEVR